MALLPRLIGPPPESGEKKIPVHQFCCAVAQYKRNKMTGPEFIAMFELTGAEVTAMQNWFANLDTDGREPAVIRAEIEDILLLGEGGQYTLTEVQDQIAQL